MKTMARGLSRCWGPCPIGGPYPRGKGEIVEEATAMGEWSEPSIQLLRYEDGSLAIRFCQYDHRGHFRRSPMMVDAKLIRGLGKSLAKTPRLRKLLKSLSA